MNQEKQILRALAKYAEMLNAHLAESLHRVRILEEVMLKHPQLFPTFQQAARDTKQTEIPGLQRQLAALRETIEKLSD